jgi:two-component system cell cycle response regulator DivK
MKRTILLIEDNEQNRYLTRFLLEGRDCVVVEAENGRLGIELASKQKFDLILLDIQLPIMDGYTVAKELRDNPATRNIPIVAVTSYAMMGDREKALSVGCDGYLEKPINPETFVSEIERFLPQP